LPVTDTDEGKLAVFSLFFDKTNDIIRLYLNRDRLGLVYPVREVFFHGCLAKYPVKITKYKRSDAYDCPISVIILLH